MSKCESKCGDNYINDLEQCEHNLIQHNIICSNCQFQCIDYCTECSFGLCQICEKDYVLIEKTNECLPKAKCDPEDGLYYNILINQCYDVCGDGLKSIYEDCEDGNLDPYDGCFDCEYSCNPLCPQCIAGVCTDDGTACKKGYYFDSQTVSCFSACGDEIIAVPDEECDALNTRKCLNCKLTIDKNCKILDENNQCLACLDGYQILDELCELLSNLTCDKILILLKIRIIIIIILMLQQIQLKPSVEMVISIKMNYVMMVIQLMGMDVIQTVNLQKQYLLFK